MRHRHFFPRGFLRLATLLCLGLTASGGWSLPETTSTRQALTRHEGTPRCSPGPAGVKRHAEQCVRAARPKTDQKDESRYAALEAASPDASAYRGGDTVVIGATTATVVLAVILLIVIL